MKSKYKVVESDGQNITIHQVTTVKGYNDGLVLYYRKPETNFDDKVLLPRSYHALRYKGQLWIGKNTGNNSAALLVDGTEVKLPEPVVGDSIDPDAPGEDLSRLGGCDLFGLGMKSVEPKRIPWAFILIALVVVVVIIIIYMRSRGG